MAAETILARRSIALSALATALAFVPGAPALAQPAPVADQASLYGGTIEVPLNRSKVVTADRPIAKVVLGNDVHDEKSAVADVLPLTDRQIIVNGKRVGTTSLALYDSAGRTMSVMNVAVGPDVDALQAQFRNLIPDQTIRANISNESIVLTGTVSNGSAADRAVQLARTFAGDKVVNLISVGSSQQVMLEVRFAEVNRTAGREIGISGFGTGSTFSGITGRGSGWQPGNPGTAITDTLGNITGYSGVTPDRFTTPGITGAFGVFRNTFNIGSLTLDAMLNALETRGMAKTLAQPTLMALSGEKASFLAGGEFPVPVAQSSGGGTAGNAAAITVQFKPFGVSLGFTPTVLGDKTVNLLVEPEVSEIDPTASLVLNGITIPGIRTRRASTTVELRDGESFALAGLLQSDFKTNIQQIPILGSIPILGTLFRSTQFQKGNTELLIVVTPHLVAPLQPGQVRLPTDRVKDPNELNTFLLGQPFEANPSPKPSAGPVAVAPPPSTAPAVPPATASAEPAKPRKDDGYAF